MLNHVETLSAEPLALDQVRATGQAMLAAGYRLVTYTVVPRPDGTLDIIYHFDKDLVMKHYRLNVPAKATLPSLSDLYFCALLIENETRDQFGLTWDGLVLDFKGHLYLEDGVTSPFAAGPACPVATISCREETTCPAQ